MLACVPLVFEQCLSSLETLGPGKNYQCVCVFQYIKSPLFNCISLLFPFPKNSLWKDSKRQDYLAILEILMSDSGRRTQI